MTWSIVMSIPYSLLGSLTMGSQFASSVLSAGSAQIVEEFGISDEVAVLGTSLFVLAYIFSPAVWSALSESYGRKWCVSLPMCCRRC